MSLDTTTIRVRVGSREVVININEGGSSSNHDDAEAAAEWEVVEASGAAPERRELEAAVGEPPLHLLRRARLTTRGDWTPERRIERAFTFGQRDSVAALEGCYQEARDDFPISSSVYVILYDPTGEWPRYTRSLSSFYQATKITQPGERAHRGSPWRRGIISRGFASIVEAEAYLFGASCRLPSREF